MSKILILDIETTALQADLGHLLTVAWKWVGDKKVHTCRIDSHPKFGSTPKSYMNDKWMVEEVVEQINTCDVLVGHYLKRFDLPFVNTRALFWKLVPAASVKVVDTWAVAKNNLAMRSNRLGALCKLLNDQDGQKGGVGLDEWKLASHGDKKTISNIMQYNIDDVLATEQLYLNLIPVMTNHPYLAQPDGGDRVTQCHVCGSHKTYSQGSYYTKLYAVRRRRCRECGTGFEEGRSKIK